jgi:hypothetical protein
MLNLRKTTLSIDHDFFSAQKNRLPRNFCRAFLSKMLIELVINRTFHNHIIIDSQKGFRSLFLTKFWRKKSATIVNPHEPATNQPLSPERKPLLSQN